MRIAIVDDTEKDRQELAAHAMGSCSEIGLPCDVLPFSSGDALLRKFRPGTLDVAILDIYMEGTDGLETARRLHMADDQLHIIFTTVTSDYALQGYEVNAAHYLVKPVTRDSIARALRRCLSRKQLDERYVTVKEGHHEYELLVSNILMAQSDRNCVLLDTTRGEVKEYTSFARFAPRLLSDARFLKCSNGVIVNLDHVSRMDKDGFVMDSGKPIPVQPRLWSALKATWMSYEAALQKEKRD